MSQEKGRCKIEVFNLCLLIWIFHRRALKHQTSKICKLALSVVYQNNNLISTELLNLYNSVKIY